METALKIFSVAIGGAFGSVARYLVGNSFLAGVFEKFPFPTFFVNIVGSFFIGFFMILFADKFVVNENLRVAIIVGFLGAFTTFSAFEAEIFGLIRERQITVSLVYVVASVLFGLVAVLAGVALGRRI